MGELKPCPFCGEAAEMDTQQAYRNISTSRMETAVAVYCTGCSAQVMICRGDVPGIEPEAVAERWNTRPRTEGRGEGEPVAYMMKTAGSGSRPVLPSYVYAWREKGVSVDAQPLYASPIREPEISRTILGDPCTLEACPTGLFVADAYNTLGMKTEYHTDKGAVEAYIVESGEFFWGDNPQTVERQRAQIVRPISHADAILNLAPVEGRGEATIAALTKALAAWHSAFETGRSEPLYAARDHSTRTVAELLFAPQEQGGVK